MNKDEIIKNIDRMLLLNKQNPNGCLIQSRQFIRTYLGSENEFLKSLEKINELASGNLISMKIQQILFGLKNYASQDLLRKISIEREIKIETVSDYLEQAQNLINDHSVHPAVPAVLIGASLEEFLRTWLEDIEFDLNTIKPNIDSYQMELRKLGKLSKQDSKDINAWAGIRNDAAHGQWENVSDRKRIILMLEGVNLFIRKYSDI